MNKTAALAVLAAAFSLSPAFAAGRQAAASRPVMKGLTAILRANPAFTHYELAHLARSPSVAGLKALQEGLDDLKLEVQLEGYLKLGKIEEVRSLLEKAAVRAGSITNKRAETLFKQFLEGTVERPGEYLGELKSLDENPFLSLDMRADLALVRKALDEEALKKTGRRAENIAQAMGRMSEDRAPIERGAVLAYSQDRQASGRLLEGISDGERPRLTRRVAAYYRDAAREPHSPEEFVLRDALRARLAGRDLGWISLDRLEEEQVLASLKERPLLSALRLKAWGWAAFSVAPLLAGPMANFLVKLDGVEKPDIAPLTLIGVFTIFVGYLLGIISGYGKKTLERPAIGLICGGFITLLAATFASSLPAVFMAFCFLLSAIGGWFLIMAMAAWASSGALLSLLRETEDAVAELRAKGF